MGKGSETSYEPAGSPKLGEPAFVVIGKLLRPHGLHGELLMQVLTDYPERIKPGQEVYIGDEHQVMHIRHCRGHHTGLLIAFEGCNDPESAGTHRNRMVSVEASSIPELPEGEYYHHQMIGLQVFLENGEPLGTVTGILETGANDVCVVRRENGQEMLIPMIEAVIVKIQLASSEMIVRLMPGLLPDG